MVKLSMVAILVIMEDVFLHLESYIEKLTVLVAILVIMEDVFLPKILNKANIGLQTGRNPCYNGRCISTQNNMIVETENVAILVIMEDVFLQFIILSLSKLNYEVAILVIMEDVFLRFVGFVGFYFFYCRNPCYNGRCISTR